MALTLAMSSTDVVATVDDASTAPPAIVGPFVLTFDPGTPTEEKVLVYGHTGNQFTGLARGYDGTNASAHQVGAVVQHTFSAQEADDANSHINATTGVHGTSSAVVGTNDAQRLTNKIIDGTQNTILNANGTPVAGAFPLFLGAALAPLAGDAWQIITVQGTVTTTAAGLFSIAPGFTVAGPRLWLATAVRSSSNVPVLIHCDLCLVGANQTGTAYDLTGALLVSTAIVITGVLIAY
jgi:hypothetical protein